MNLARIRDGLQLYALTEEQRATVDRRLYRLRDRIDAEPKPGAGACATGSAIARAGTKSPTKSPSQGRQPRDYDCGGGRMAPAPHESRCPPHPAANAHAPDAQDQLPTACGMDPRLPVGADGAAAGLELETRFVCLRRVVDALLLAATPSSLAQRLARAPAHALTGVASEWRRSAVSGVTVDEDE
jgi:hypothetical protein